MSWGSSKEYVMQHPSSLAELLRMSPWHDQREFAERSLSRVLYGTQPYGLQPLPEVRVSYPLASTSTQVLSPASTSAGTRAVCVGQVCLGDSGMRRQYDPFLYHHDVMLCFGANCTNTLISEISMNDTYLATPHLVWTLWYCHKNDCLHSPS